VKEGESFLDTTQTNFTPTTLQDRVEALDILRGFSLLGILLVNIIAFYTPQPYIDLGSWFTDASDIIWHQRLDIYVQSSFYPLFAMLFGYGLAMQWAKAERVGINFYKIGSRRLVTLLLFGVIHAFAIWWGDILMTYAISGLLLLMFLRMKPLFLVATALLLNLVFHMFMLFIVGYIYLANQEMGTAALDIISIEKSITAYGAGNWLDAFSQRVQDTIYQNNILMLVMIMLTILPYMLVGAAASKWRLIERAKDFKVSWIVVGVVFFGVGLFIKGAPILWERTYLLDYLKVYVGGPLMSIGYIGLIISLLFIPQVTTLLSPISKIGRMSITTYIMQSIILSLLFYNFGIGWYGKLDVRTGIIVAMVIYIVQIIFVELWLSKFKQGPIEGLWRKLTYEKILSKK